ncbi:MerR family transcriptional regulator [Rhodophyticola sp. CCM32]|uniref:MerR family transcriptional regulator n=1 Tax=Rhodophyticola sp. CCM32 TaxID=2916397 RepID=UPI00107EEED0|nr:MerR family transcriptional regulator [Rhodophyticola sp. CCM32]QBY00144.1 MerR family transcriptional regulator [Rhodophyticola sp. CCM32]
MRIGELAKRSGFSRDAIRFYERNGLISADTREGENNYKSYPEEAVLTLEVVRDAQAAGVSIGDLSIILSQLAAEDSDSFDGDAFLADKIAEVEDRIAASQRFLETLRVTRKALSIAPLNTQTSHITAR